MNCDLRLEGACWNYGVARAILSLLQDGSARFKRDGFKFRPAGFISSAYCYSYSIIVI